MNEETLPILRKPTPEKRVLAVGRVFSAQTRWRSTNSFRVERGFMMATTADNGCPCLNCKEAPVKTKSGVIIHHEVQL